MPFFLLIFLMLILFHTHLWRVRLSRVAEPSFDSIRLFAMPEREAEAPVRHCSLLHCRAFFFPAACFFVFRHAVIFRYHFFFSVPRSPFSPAAYLPTYVMPRGVYGAR